MTKLQTGMARHEEVRARALEDMRRFEVVMDGHFDYGNGYHGKLYLNPHRLFQWPSTIWRVAQDLIDVMPSEFIERAEIVAGPTTGGALLAHTVAGLLDGRRPMTHPPYSFAPFADHGGHAVLSPFYASRMTGKRVLIVDDVRNTGTTLKECADLVATAGGTLIGTMQIIDRCEACISLEVPNVSLVEYKAPPNYPAASCPMCAAHVPITAF
ncbi:MAG TPA: phosphoribosyltransferase family protein [Vicinamibacterales bacterium]|nr:phosphoribosyltransferase family protein [Vicinamibacterales bacterium]